MRWTAAILLLLTLAAPTSAGWTDLRGKPAPEPGIEKWLAAPEGETLADLRGRAVLLLLGGAPATGPLDDLRAAYWEEGLRVVSLLPAAPAEPPAGVEHSIAVGSFEAYGEGEGVRAVLVDPEGDVSWEGKPGELEDEVVAAVVKKCRMFDPGKTCEAVKAAAAAFRKGRLSEARELAKEALLAEGAGDEAVLDAGRIQDRVAALLAYWVRQADRAEKSGCQLEATTCLELVEKHFPGTPEAAAAAEKLAGRKGDAAVKAEISAEKAYLRFRTEFLRAGGKKKKLDALVKKLERYVERNGGTRGAERAARLLDTIRTDPALAAIRAFIAKEGIRTTGSTWRTSLELPPKLEFSPGKSYFWNLETNKGPMKIRFLPDVAPMHVSSTIYLTELGFYDGLIFHRVIPGFMAQGGCPLGTGGGQPGYKYEGEFSGSAKHSGPGVLSMANSGPGTDGSQFFITFGAASHLDGKHTVFGKLVEGMGTLKKLEEQGTPGGAPKEKLVLEKATISVE